MAGLCTALASGQNFSCPCFTYKGCAHLLVHTKGAHTYSSAPVRHFVLQAPVPIVMQKSGGDTAGACEDLCVQSGAWRSRWGMFCHTAATYLPVVRETQPCPTASASPTTIPPVGATPTRRSCSHTQPRPGHSCHHAPGEDE